MVGGLDPRNAALGRRDDLGEGVAGQVGQLHPLEAGPQRLHRVQLGRVGGQRSWLVVEPLPGYAPDLNPVEGLWSSLKGVELANLAADTSPRSSPRPSAASSGSATPTTWPTRSCDTVAWAYGEQ